MLDLTEAQLAVVQALLARHVPDREVQAFGSRVQGRAWRYSDLDLLVQGEAMPARVRAHLVADFEDSDLPFRVDVLTAADLPDGAVTRIMSASQRIFPTVDGPRKALPPGTFPMAAPDVDDAE